jgi:hypothetical protein
MYQRRRRDRKRDQEFEVEVGRDENQLHDRCRVPQGVKSRGTSGQLDKPQGRLNQFMKGEPEVLDMPLLREIENEQEQGKHQGQNGVDYPGQPLKKAVGIP